MRRYTADEEQRVRRQAEVRDWARAGLLRQEQAAVLLAQLRTDLKRTNELLRAALALFTLIIASAAVALVVVSLEIHDRASIAVLCVSAGAACAATADYLVGAFRLYRHGVEEGLAIAAVLLAAVGVAEALGASPYFVWWRVWLIVASIAAFAVYLRFGFVYAAVGALIFAAAIPFQFQLANAVERMLAAAIFGTTFVVARAGRGAHGDEFPGDEYASLQAAACAGLYLVLNVRIGDATPPLGLSAPSVPPWFYWSSYAATWLISAAALTIAIRSKDRALLTVGIALALCTLVTNKPYLGMTRQTWDPMILGVLLAGGALALRRWLDAGPNGQRAGFTAARILARDRDILSALATASVAWHARHQDRPPHDASTSEFAGGRSGGAGGGAEY
jgi:hypothetical protein